MVNPGLSTLNVRMLTKIYMGGIFIKGKLHTPEQVIQKLAEGDRLLNAGSSVV